MGNRNYHDLLLEIAVDDLVGKPLHQKASMLAVTKRKSFGL